MMAEFPNIRVLDMLPKISCPTLVLHSREDGAVPVQEGKLIAARIRGSRFVELPSRSHMVAEETRRGISWSRSSPPSWAGARKLRHEWKRSSPRRTLHGKCKGRHEPPSLLAAITPLNRWPAPPSPPGRDTAQAMGSASARASDNPGTSSREL